MIQPLDSRYPPVNRCIYCTAENDLTDEHIIPFGLSGTAVLPKASCKKCAAVTSLIERQVLREGTMQQVRVIRELKSRRKHKDAPKSGQLLVPREDGTENPTEIELPLSEYPVLLFMPRFAAPAAIEPDGYERGIHVAGFDLHSFGPRPDEAMKKLGISTATWTAPASYPASFARMLGKIAYSSAVADGAWPMALGLPTVVSSILGTSDEIGRWVGTTPRPNTSYPGLLHRLAVQKSSKSQRILVEVQLFADSETQTYGVVLQPQNEQGNESDQRFRSG